MILMAPLEDGKVHGKVTASVQNAGIGDKVILKIEPDENYRLGTLIGIVDVFNMFRLEPDEEGNCSFTMPASSLILLGTFEGEPYTVTFDANGGTGEMPQQEFAYGEEQNLSENRYTRDHYTFRWWNTAKDGTGEP